MPLSSDVSVLVRELISADLAWVASEIIEAIELPQPVSVTSGEVKDASPLPSGAPFLLPTHQSGSTAHRLPPRATSASKMLPTRAGVMRCTTACNGSVSCPLLSGPWTMTVWIKEGTTNACQEAQARGDHRQAA